jgi:hypothetical protein
MLIASWVGLEILVDPYSLATTAEIKVRVSHSPLQSLNLSWRERVLVVRYWGGGGTGKV